MNVMDGPLAVTAHDHPLKVFVCSSSEGKGLARQIVGWLNEAGHTAIPWWELFRPGEMTLQALLNALDDADAAVSVFSPDDRTEVRDETTLRPRDNVVFEFGLFAGRLGVQRVVICSAKVAHDGRHARRPTDLDGLTFIDVTEPDDGRARVVGWANHLDPKSLPGLGIVGSRNGFPLEAFCERVREAKLVRILQTFIPSAEHWVALRRSLEHALRRGAKVQVLLCDRRSVASDMRRVALLPQEVNVVREIATNLQALGNLYVELRQDGLVPDLEVKEYPTLPALTLYQADNAFLVGHYWHGRFAIHGPHFRVKGTQSDWGKTLKHEFERVWALSFDVDPEDPLRARQ